MFHVGIDIGSTTVKIVVFNSHKKIVYSRYERHYADVKKKLQEILQDAKEVLNNSHITVMITGSGGMNIANSIGVSFIQEVVASAKAIRNYHPETDVAIELRGEDAKITYFSNGVEQRMNGTCAGGTGSFINQIDRIIHVNTIENEADQIYRKAIRKLFENPSDVIYVTKWKDIYKYIEDSIDSRQGVIDVCYTKFRRSYVKY